MKTFDINYFNEYMFFKLFVCLQADVRNIRTLRRKLIWSKYPKLKLFLKRIKQKICMDL